MAPPPAGVSITCKTSTDRFAPFSTVIGISTFLPGNFITLDNSGNLAGGTGIFTSALLANTVIRNSGDIAAAGLGNFGISAATGTGHLFLANSGDIATAGLGTFGISAVTGIGDLELGNGGNIAAAGLGVFGISAVTGLGDLDLRNAGNIAVTGLGVLGISAVTGVGDLKVSNTGNLAARGDGAFGISAVTGTGDISLGNGGNVTVRGDSVRALSASSGGSLRLNNGGKLFVKGENAFGITGTTGAADADILNDAEITVSGKNATGIAGTTGAGFLSLNNEGHLSITGNQAVGMAGESTSGGVSLINSGKVTVTGGGAVGLSATGMGSAPVSVTNSGDVHATGIGAAVVAGNSAQIKNSGTLFGDDTGIAAIVGNKLTILNSGSISAGNNFAVGAIGSTINVINTGVITGSVQLLGKTTFENQTSGLFDAFDSEFGIGVFHNQPGATVRTARDPLIRETVTFDDLRVFRNEGTVTLVDGNPGDVFDLSDCGCVRPTYVGKGEGAVAVDVFLGGPGSPADNVVIDGDVKGKTALVVNNTNPGNGATNKEGIPVVFVEGNVAGNQFYLKDGPIDAGLVAYDLFFTKTGSGFFELRTIPDGHTGSFLLPELTTASQDVFFATTETWFDRTADLRVLLAGGGPGVQPVANPADGDGSLPFNPAIWARAGGAQLNQGDTAGATAYGRSYNFNMARDLEIMNFETGLDLGKRDVLTDGDILVFGVLGGAINAVLDYNQIVRQFSYEGGEVGVYATYLRGGFFVDTLAKADFLTLNPRDVRGFPDKLDDTNVGGRVDAGYRFGGFNGGMFLEPLATIAVAWANVEGFTKDGNNVEFEDETNVRGRLGLRVGTSMAAWEGATFEPFVIGSVWSTLGGTNSATLTSLGTTFPTFSDESTDVWGEVSAGVNFFVPDKQTSVFAKVDVSFGEDLDGVGGRAGMRYNW